MSDKSLADRLEAARHMRSDPREMDALIVEVRELERALERAGHQVAAADQNFAACHEAHRELEKCAEDAERRVRELETCDGGFYGRAAARLTHKVAALEGILREAPEPPPRYRKGMEGAWLDYDRQSAEWLARARGVLGEGQADGK